MKIRIKGNSIRLRLSQPEVEKLKVRGELIEHTTFSDAQAFGYGIQRSKDQLLSAQFQNGHIIVKVPETTLERWVDSDLVGFDNTGSNSTLSILVEKDFKCMMDRPHEDEDDLYPNPDARR